MEFEDNFVCPKVYPYSRYMYDPLLKVRVVIGSFSEQTHRDVPIAIFYDPEIEAGHLSVPVTEETKAAWRASPLRRHMADDETFRFPFQSDKSVSFESTPCRWDDDGNIIRLKVSIKCAFFQWFERNMKAMEIPIISDDPLSFLLYVYKNYTKIPALANEYYKKDFLPHANRVEMCLNADAFLNAFKLSPDDYAEVEPGWFCLASKEIVR